MTKIKLKPRITVANCGCAYHAGRPRIVTRTELLDAFEAVAHAANRLAASECAQFGTDAERAEYRAAFGDDLDARQTMIDAIYGLDIPA